jgi:hypothetical protein
MVKQMTVNDSTYEQLENSAQDDESAADALRRILQSPAAQEVLADTGAGGDDPVEQLAAGVLNIEDLRAIEQTGQQSAAEYLSAQYGLDPSEYSDEAELLAAKQEGETTPGHPDPVDLSGAAGGADDEAEQLAEQVLNLGDLRAMDRADLGAAEYLAERYDVDASRYADESQLRAAIRSADGGDGQRRGAGQ